MLPAYRPSNRLPWHGLVFLLLAISSGGLVFGGFAFAISRVFWFILLFPAGIGFMAGTILVNMIARHHVRSPRISALCALLMGLVVYSTFHYLAYAVFQTDVRHMLTTTYGLTDFDLQQQALNEVLLRHTGATGFWGYLHLQAHEGVSIGRWGFTSGVTLNEPLTWLYWFIELSCIVNVASIVAVEAAKKPFCEACRTWYRGGKQQGSVGTSDMEHFVTLVRTGSFRQAGALVNGDTTPPNLEVYLHQCPRADEHNAILSVRRTTENATRHLQFTDLFEGMLTPQQVADLHNGRYPATETVVPAN